MKFVGDFLTYLRPVLMLVRSTGYFHLRVNKITQSYA